MSREITNPARLLAGPVGVLLLRRQAVLSRRIAWYNHARTKKASTLPPWLGHQKSKASSTPSHPSAKTILPDVTFNLRSTALPSERRERISLASGFLPPLFTSACRRPLADFGFARHWASSASQIQTGEISVHDLGRLRWAGDGEA